MFLIQYLNLTNIIVTMAELAAWSLRNIHFRLIAEARVRIPKLVPKRSDLTKLKPYCLLQHVTINNYGFMGLVT